MIPTGETRARAIGQPQNIAVVVASGNLVAHVRMDGAWIGSVDVSINKAFTARAFDITTKDLAANAEPGGQFYGVQRSNEGRVMVFAGGVPQRRRRTRRDGHRGRRRVLIRAGNRAAWSSRVPTSGR